MSETPEDVCLNGCPVEVWDGPYLMRCAMGVTRCATHGPFERAKRCDLERGCRRPAGHGGRCNPPVADPTPTGGLPRVSTGGCFYEEDEPVGKIQAAFEGGEKGVTAAPVAKDVYRAAAEAALRRHVGDDQVDGLSAEYLDELITDWWDTPDSRARVDAAYAAGREAAAQAIEAKAKDLDFRLFAKHQFQSSRLWPDGTKPTAPNWNPGCTCGASHYYFEHPRHLAEVAAEYTAEIARGGSDG